MHAGIVFNSSSDIGTVGDTITFDCSSDLHPIRITLYRDGAYLSQSSEDSEAVTLDLISTDDEGAVYTCKASSHRGSQERNKILHVEGIQQFCITIGGVSRLIITVSGYASIKSLREGDFSSLSPLHCDINISLVILRQFYPSAK